MQSFWEQVNKTPSCWVWTGKVSSNGYGYFQSFKKVHRLSYELHKGEIPKGKVIKHSCDNKLCVNPEHLELGTYSENLKEAYDRGLRKPKGSQRDSIRLSQEQLDYLMDSPKSLRSLSIELGISVHRVKSIRSGTIRLKELDIPQIRGDVGTISELAKKYGIHKHRVAEIREGVHKTITPVTQELLGKLKELSRTLIFNGHPNYSKIAKKLGKTRKWVRKNVDKGDTTRIK